MKINFYKKYFLQVSQDLSNIDEKKLLKLSKILLNLKKKNKIIFVGNGGSASIANHCSTDFAKMLGKRSMTFNEPNLITCLANDYGHENWMKEALKIHALPGDILILISSSGNSKNIINCAKQAKKMKIKLITFSGFSKKNKLRSKGLINFWVNSKIYNQIEMIHHIWLLSVCDFLIKLGKKSLLKYN